ncbi:PLP-dependent aminotransferase family protein [Kribbella italica]|uniref:DNA-binding transcriptional MocR family regulator n=1 Tax=Kribbella italica TaxID=1540520 RepID=A0A7W9JGZ6_9ACTN|nr:PLP-dependent aminotransferase family protein [Kribbella italica]MBB5841572.1 DNA-binding transcriptional MocR family regulator [Kribbella italica]
MDLLDGSGLRFPADQVARMMVGTGARSGPLYRQLSDSLAELIDRGELPPSAVLPPERALATALTVSRTTVVAAYQALRESGRLERRQGSGTRVRADRGRETVSNSLLAGDHAASQFLDGPLATIDFATAALPSLDLVADVASSLTRDDYLRLTSSHHGYHLRGLTALRERIARWYSDGGVPTTPEEILITSGAQQALELVARGCLHPGDGVIVEQPTYRGALEAFSRTGSRLRPVRADEDGLDVRSLETLLRTGSPRLVYVQAAVHNPTGAVLSEDRRQRLARLVDQHEFVLVDDTSLAGTGFAEGPGTPALGSHERIVTIGSMSKLFWGGLRLGWIRAVPQVVSRLAQVRGITDLGSSLVAQEVAVRLLDHSSAASAERRSTLPGGLRTLTDLLATQLPDWTWQQPRGGASLWVRLPQGDATHLAQLALRYGVALLPGSVFSADGSTDNHTRLPFALPPATLHSGITRLAQAWQTYLERGAVDVTVTSTIT